MGEFSFINLYKLTNIGISMLTKKNRFVAAGKKILHSKIFHYDVLILGGGPAGLTAAIYSSRFGMKTGLISRDIGGSANLAHKIENYPGFVGSGAELMQKFHQQAKKFGAEFLADDVANLQKDENGFVVYTANKKIIHTRTIILALGTQRRKLNVEGEDKFLGKGVSYCAVCDAVFFKGKDGAVIGGSDAAGLDALILAGIANKVYVIHRGEKLRCEEITNKNLCRKKNVEFILNAVPVEIKGKEIVSGLLIEKNGKKTEIKVSGVFIEIGRLPLSDIAKMLNVKLDEEYIPVDEEMRTNVKGVFASGDVVKSKLKQVVVAAAQGAQAARSAYDFVKEKWRNNHNPTIASAKGNLSFVVFVCFPVNISSNMNACALSKSSTGKISNSPL